jgi:hypothetical protein
MAKNPKDYAIIVGIDRYRSGGIDSLQGAVNDASLFYDWIVDPAGGGLDPANATLFTSPAAGPFAPDRNAIEDQLLLTVYQEMLKGVRPVGRRLYLFMAGHGVAPSDGDDCSLVGADSFINSLRVLTGRMTADRILRQPMFQEVVLFMSCCRDVNGSATYCNLPAPGDPLPNSTYLHGLAVKWAKKALEKQLPHPTDPTKPPLWQSVFSHALIKGLNSAFDDGGRVTSQSLRGFVKQQVVDLLPPGNNTLPQFFLDEDLAPIVFNSRPPAAAAPIVEQTVPTPPGPRSILAETAPAVESTRPPLRGSRAPRGAVQPAQPAAAAPPAGLIPVKVTLSGGATTFEALDGETLAKLDPPMETLAAGTFRVFLKPSLYAFRVPGGQAKPVSVLGEAISVEL